MWLPPPLHLQVIYFDESDREEARKLGLDLYDHVTRPADDPLGYGAGIPVSVAIRYDRISLEYPETLMLIPVLGPESFQDGDVQQRILASLEAWHSALGAGRVIPVPLSRNWRDLEGKVPGKFLLTELGGAASGRGATLDEIVLAAARLLDSRTGGVKPFISHAKLDLEPTDDAAASISRYVSNNTTARSFFDTKDLYAGESLADQLDTALGAGILVVVRGDAYSSRVWCQRELLRAKRNQLPTLTVEILRRGEARSSPYAGNGPCMVWDGDPAKVASRAMVEWLRKAYFFAESKRVKAATGLPKDTPVAARPPELLDLAQGPLADPFAQLVLHPDPELPVIEREILKAVRPSLHLVTPTTAFRRLVGRGKEPVDVSSPLDGKLVAMSLSETPDAGGPEGFTAQHAVDATVYVARTLISAGASIAYAGDFQPHQIDYTRLLVRLIQTYKQTAAKEPDYLHNFVAMIVNTKAGADLPLRTRKVPDPTPGTSHPKSLYFADMRRYMESHTHARVILGGKKTPRAGEGDQKGYGGRFPGIVEEAWWCLHSGHPLYVLGGFGGAAAWVADLCEARKIPAELQDEAWLHFPRFARIVAETNADDEFRQTLGLPLRMQDLAAELRELAAPYRTGDAQSLTPNGLTKAENQLLFRSRDPVILAALVTKGLLALARAEMKGKLKIELVQGSVTTASNLDLIALATVVNVPLGGAGAELDRAVGGRVALERDQQSLIRVRNGKIDCDYLYLASLGEVNESTGLAERVQAAARETADKCQGFDRVGVVTFGGGLRPDFDPLVRAMVDGFRGLPERTTLVWFENDRGRFEKLKSSLTKLDAVAVTTHESVVAPPVPNSRVDPLILQVLLEQGSLCATTIPPAGSAVASMTRRVLSDDEVAKLSRGANGSRRTPGEPEVAARGAELAALLLGDGAAEILEKCRKSRLIVSHDAQASKLPFEMLAAGFPPALESGITRRLLAQGVPVESQFARPPREGRLEILLVVDPTLNLPGAAEEGARVKSILSAHADRITVHEINGAEATIAKVSAALARADVLHYCGHAFFDGPGAEQSGLILADGDLTAACIRQISKLPAMAFVNACEAARVRGQVPATETAVFAEVFLRSGVDAYVGTYWQVGDSAAASFAASVYASLANGETLEASVLEARRVLKESHEPDWANYILFGGGDFRLVAG